MNAAASPPLWRLLQGAAEIVARVVAGGSATEALARVEPSLRPGVQALAYHALRHLGRAQALRRLLAQRPPAPAVDALLCTALALGWREQDAPYEVFTLVNQAVEAAKRDPATRAASGFVNGCLRRFLRERDALVQATDANPEARWNHPRWWIEQLRRDHPDAWEEILRVDNGAPPMTLRVNTRRGTRHAYLERLAAAGIEAHPIGEHGAILAKARPVQELPGFEAGDVSVQDAAAQIAAPLLLRELPQGRPVRLLDACAAPGGKTAHLLELAQAEVTAIDIAPERCERIRGTLARLGLAAHVIAADASKPEAWWDGRPYDGILLDAPCTASGIVRRHPDVRWLRRESDIAQLAATQAKLLEVLWPLLAPGGRLLYCTCSVFRREGESQLGSFLARHKDALSRPGPGHLLPHSSAGVEGVPDNPAGDHDGFFYALLAKTPGA